MGGLIIFLCTPILKLNRGANDEKQSESMDIK